MQSHFGTRFYHHKIDLSGPKLILQWTCQEQRNVTTELVSQKSKNKELSQLGIIVRLVIEVFEKWALYPK